MDFLWFSYGFSHFPMVFLWIVLWILLLTNVPPESQAWPQPSAQVAHGRSHAAERRRGGHGLRDGLQLRLSAAGWKQCLGRLGLGRRLEERSDVGWCLGNEDHENICIIYIYIYVYSIHMNICICIYIYICQIDINIYIVYIYIYVYKNIYIYTYLSHHHQCIYYWCFLFIATSIYVFINSMTMCWRMGSSQQRRGLKSIPQSSPFFKVI